VNVVVNGEPAVVALDTTVAALLRAREVEERGTAVAVNGDVVLRRHWGTSRLQEGDRVELLTVAQGG
jgi:sulfur carrier protein